MSGKIKNYWFHEALPMKMRNRYVKNKIMICNATTKDQMSEVKKAISEFVEKGNFRLFRVSVDGVNNSQCQVILYYRLDTITQTLL